MELKPGGSKIAVTDENKEDFVKLICQHRMITSIRSQVESFLDGFYELVPPELISIFTPTELELLICGLPEIDLKDLMANTEYQNFQPMDDIISWFWKVLDEFNSSERASFLQFVTGKILILFTHLILIFDIRRNK